MARTVLIVDDHDRFRAVTRRSLEGCGWTVVGEAVDGASALAAVGATRPEVLLLDVGLPDMSGIDVARRLRDVPEAPTVVLVSTHDAADYAELLPGSGAVGFLPKSELTPDAIECLLADSHDRG